MVAVSLKNKKIVEEPIKEEGGSGTGTATGEVEHFFKQKTAYEISVCDWSSDVCSSDLGLAAGTRAGTWRQDKPPRHGRAYG